MCRGEEIPEMSLDFFFFFFKLKDLNLLDRCIKETLRLRPPIMTLMRMARTPQVSVG